MIMERPDVCDPDFGRNVPPEVREFCLVPLEGPLFVDDFRELVKGFSQER